MKIESFTELRAWQAAHRLALTVYRLTQKFPGAERFGIVAQVRRSAASTAANIAEGYGRRTTKELIRCLQIARGELEETRCFMILARDLEFVTQTDFVRVNEECDGAAKLINALAASLKRRLASG